MAKERLRLISSSSGLEDSAGPTGHRLQSVFDASMDAVGPFERRPHLAIAVSGGADSMALALLAQEWTQAYQGSLTCLIVDHGLRIEASTEAVRTVEELSRLGLEAEIIEWIGEKPKQGLQAAAREARYALLEDWCRANAVLHLLLGHHAGDQAETILMRLERGSGPDGLAGMSVVTERRFCQVIRPLLDAKKDDLVDFLQRRNVAWLEDPSNHDARFTRTRLRRELADNPERNRGLFESARRFAVLRNHMDVETARWLAANVRVDPLGYALVDYPAFAAASSEIRHRVIRNLAHGIGGTRYRPSVADAEPLLEALMRGKGATLSRAAFSLRGRRLLVYRENRNFPERVRVDGCQTTQTLYWDGRFRLEIAPHVEDVSVLPWSKTAMAGGDDSPRCHGFQKAPHVVLPGLPMIETGARRWLPWPGVGEHNGIKVKYYPRAPIGGAGFFVA